MNCGQSIHNYYNYNSAQVIRITLSDTERSLSFIRCIFNILKDALMISVIILGLLIVDYKLTIIIFFLLATSGYIFYLFYKPLYLSYGKNSQLDRQSLNRVTYESIGSIKNIKLSIIGVVPNFLAAFFILGIIGIMGIPLDMMTITIAAITIGIAVDNSIHYIYRFREEFSDIKDYDETIERCHSTVGVAIINTSITIVFGFSILVLSNFIPTIYFGVFTGIAMLLAMISVLTLLPSLIIISKPFEYLKN